MHRKTLASVMALCLFTVAALLCAGCGGATVAETTMEEPRLHSGTISGTLVDGVWTYKGVPFAAPPTGELRWKEPQPVEPWDGVLACDEYGPACPQPRDWEGVPDVGHTDEDCLYLNVWTPAENPGERLPVMVWIHGGAFIIGTGSLPIYDGHYLAEKGVVVVTINYRVGPFGFLAHPLLSAESERGVSGNYGMLDQVAALEWVQENIGVFGGDPGNITVFGESAGGMSILYLMTSPLAEGLFHRAAVQSGPMFDLGLPVCDFPTLEQAEKTGEAICRKLGCEGEGDELAALREVTPEALMEASAGDSMSFIPINLSPNVDGHLLLEQPFEAFAAGRQCAVPLLTGVNANEGTGFVSNFTLDYYRHVMSSLYGDMASEVESLYPAQTDTEANASAQKLVTEMGFAASARFTADSMDGVGAPAYLYLFNQAPQDPRTQHLGVYHGLEVMYVFGNLGKVDMEGAGEADYALSEAVMAYWTYFAAGGDPNGEGVPLWPAFSSGAGQYQELGQTISTRTGYYPEAYDLVKKFKGL